MLPLQIVLYFLFVSICGCILTFADKRAARHSLVRVSEKTLLFVAFFGGSTAMYLMMKIIRHKTRRKRFMIGLPIMTAAHCLILLALRLFVL